MNSILSSAEQYGPAINSKVATRFEGLLNREFTKDDSEKLKAQFLPPENAPLLGIPRIQPALWNSLPVKARSIDAKLQDTQRKVNQAFIGTAQIMDMMEQNWKMIPKDLRTSLITKTLNISKSLAMSVKELSQQRRLALRPFLRKEVTTVGNNLGPSANLFGDKLEENVKTAKAAASMIRTFNNSTNNNNNTRFHPYAARRRDNNNANHLNYRSNFREKGGGVTSTKPSPITTTTAHSHIRIGSSIPTTRATNRIHPTILKSGTSRRETEIFCSQLD